MGLADTAWVFGGGGAATLMLAGGRDLALGLRGPRSGGRTAQQHLAGAAAGMGGANGLSVAVGGNVGKPNVRLSWSP